MMLNDKVRLKALRNCIDDALAHVAEGAGLASLKTGSIRYDQDGVTAKITVEAVARSADGKTKAQLDFEKYHDLFGLKPDDFGKRFISRKGEFEIIGLLPSRSKFPILGRNTETNKEMLFTTDVVKRLNQ